MSSYAKTSSSYNPSPITTGNNDAIVTGAGILGGIFVSALGSSPTITVYDDLNHGSTAKIATFVPVVGMYNLDMFFATGLSIVIGGTGNTNITVLTGKANTV